MFTFKSLITPFFLSFFIYSEYFEFVNFFLNTFTGLVSIYLLFVLTKRELFTTGTIVGVLWFWWLGYSFVYYDLLYLIPIVLIGIGILYGVLFYFIGFFNNILYRLFYIFVLSFMEPFSFNWFKLELLFINSYIGTSKIEFIVILVLTAFFIFFISKYKIKIAIGIYSVGLLILIYFNTNNVNNTIQNHNLKIFLNETNIDQDKKWNGKYKNDIITDNINNINSAIKNEYDLIIFPETSYPIVLNKNNELQNILLEKSKKISILLGSLYEKDDLYYNSSYLFENGQMQVAHKVVLVPFGEAVPLPAKIRDFINNTFYNGAKDYETAKEPTTFNIKGVKFRNAICYEATTNKIYEDIDTNFVIAISNNGWFVPSVEPVLQRLLLKFYAKKYNLLIYNITNKSKSGIIQ